MKGKMGAEDQGGGQGDEGARAEARRQSGVRRGGERGGRDGRNCESDPSWQRALRAWEQPDKQAGRTQAGDTL